MAAPQPQIALCIEGAADRRELCPVLVQRFQRQRTAAKAHFTGEPVCHDMDGFDPGAILQGASHLGRARSWSVSTTLSTSGRSPARNVSRSVTPPPRDKAEILAQALPYIRRFHGKTWSSSTAATP
jgi:hypothetical protein